MKNTLILSFALLLLSSCASHIGMVNSNAINNDIKYEDIAVGVAQTEKIFGIGGTSKDALVFEAKRAMIKNNPLKSGEQYINYTVDFKNSLYFVYFQTKATVSADIISFKKHNSDSVYSEKYLQKLSQKTITNNIFEVGDSVIFSDSKLATIIAIEDAKHVRLLYENQNGKAKTFRAKIKDIFSMHKAYNGIKPGDMISYKDSDNNDYNGRVLGTGQLKVIAKIYGGKLEKIDYDRINQR